jgi:hypothetical protein
MLNANKKKDFFGSFSIVKNIFIMSHNAYSINLMLRWIKREETWQEIHNIGGKNSILNSVKKANKQQHQSSSQV